jgi:hypothetical protein
MPREKAQAVTAARPKVPKRRLGAHCLVVAMKRGNARGAKGVGHQRWIGSTGVGSTGSGRNLIINGRRQPSHGGTSRMMREYHVRICEGLGVQLPGSTRHEHQFSGRARYSSDRGRIGALISALGHGRHTYISTPTDREPTRDGPAASGSPNPKSQRRFDEHTPVAKTHHRRNFNEAIGIVGLVAAVGA